MVFYLLLDWPGDTEYTSSQHDTIINSLRTRTTLVLPTKYNTQRTVLYSVDERDSENTAMHAVSPVSSPDPGSGRQHPPPVPAWPGIFLTELNI